MTKTQVKVGLAVLAAGLLASVTSASAGYRGHYYHPDSYVYNGNGSNYSKSYHYNSYESDEIRELRRAFPSTNWPPSDRY